MIKSQTDYFFLSFFFSLFPLTNQPDRSTGSIVCSFNIFVLLCFVCKQANLAYGALLMRSIPIGDMINHKKKMATTPHRYSQKPYEWKLWNLFDVVVMFNTRYFVLDQFIPAVYLVRLFDDLLFESPSNIKPQLCSRANYFTNKPRKFMGFSLCCWKIRFTSSYFLLRWIHIHYYYHHRTPEQQQEEYFDFIFQTSVSQLSTCSPCSMFS